MMNYENVMNKRYKEAEDGKFEDATKEILEAIPADIHGFFCFFSNGNVC